MKQFEKFIESISSKGFYSLVSRKQVPLFDPTMLVQCVPFVFLPVGEQNREVETSEKPLDLPFKNIFIELFGEETCITDMGDLGSVRGIFIREEVPKKYIFWLLFEDDSSKNTRILSFDAALKIKVLEKEDAVYTHFINLTRAYLDRIYKEKVGESNPRKFIKLKINSKKINYRIKKVVYISPKSQKEFLASENPNKIIWTHRWRVRGHWRSIPGKFGKDRENLPVQNFTWVTDYVKGPEESVLINKLRAIN